MTTRECRRKTATFSNGHRIKHRPFGTQPTRARIQRYCKIRVRPRRATVTVLVSHAGTAVRPSIKKVTAWLRPSFEVLRPFST